MNVRWRCGVQGAETMRKDACVTRAAPPVACHIAAVCYMLHRCSASCCRCGLEPCAVLGQVRLAASILTSFALMPASALV